MTAVYPRLGRGTHGAAAEKQFGIPAIPSQPVFLAVDILRQTAAALNTRVHHREYRTGVNDFIKKEISLRTFATRTEIQNVQPLSKTVRNKFRSAIVQSLIGPDLPRRP